MAGALHPTMDTLPAILPVFPLPGALLLPGGNLPLNIFEPRYLAMVNAVLKTDSRLIGMIQPADPEGDPGPGNLCRVGCAGRITHFEETEDGRYGIQLTGVVRFKVEREIDLEQGFRRVFPDYQDYTADLAPTAGDGHIDRNDLMMATREYFHANGYETDWDALDKTSILTLVTSLSMACPFDCMEKQALLEARDQFERASILSSLLKMGAVPNSNLDDPEANLSVN